MFYLNLLAHLSTTVPKSYMVFFFFFFFVNDKRKYILPVFVQIHIFLGKQKEACCVAKTLKINFQVKITFSKFYVHLKYLKIVFSLNKPVKTIQGELLKPFLHFTVSDYANENIL